MKKETKTMFSKTQKAAKKSSLLLFNVIVNVDEYPNGKLLSVVLVRYS